MARRLLDRASMRLVIVSFALLGCVESHFDELPPAQQNVDLLPPIDAFWLHQAAVESTTPIPERPRSISLGYVGNTPLAGGVMRDTPVMFPTTVPTSCSCSREHGYVVSPE